MLLKVLLPHIASWVSDLFSCTEPAFNAKCNDVLTFINLVTELESTNGQFPACWLSHFQSVRFWWEKKLHWIWLFLFTWSWLFIFSLQCACVLAKNLAYVQKFKKLEVNLNFHVLFLCLNPQFGQIFFASS